MKRLVLALLALLLLAPVALSLSRTGEEVRAQTTGAAPAFEDASITYLLDAGSDGSSTAIAIGTPAFTAGSISGGTDACSENLEVVRTTATVGVTGTTSSVFTVGADCAITYTGAASASAISAMRAGWVIRIDLTDGVDASGGADTTTDDTIDVLVRLVNGATEFADATAFRDALGGASWTGRWPAAADTDVATFAISGRNSVYHGYTQGQGGTTLSPATFTHGGTTYTVHYLGWRWFNPNGVIEFTITPRAPANTFNDMKFRIGSIVTNALGAPADIVLTNQAHQFRTTITGRSGSGGSPFPSSTETYNLTLFDPGPAYTAVPDGVIATVTGTAGASGARVGVSHPMGSGSYGSLSASTFTYRGTAYTVRRIYWSTGSSEAGLHFGVSPQTGGANFAGLKLRFGSTLTGALSGAPTQGYGQGVANQGYKWRPSLASSPLTSGSAFSFDLVGTSPWHGVTVTSGRVTALDLSDNGLAGTIPAAVGGFADLTSLDLSENPGLTGAIPAELGQLEALTSLDLGVLGVETDPGMLTGTIPASLGRLTSLTTLDLSGHAGLTGSIPAALTRITGLTHLDLSRTGVCVNPATEPGIVTWINAIRATGTNTGVARVAACGAPALPAFTDGAAVTRGLESGASGAGTGNAITIGTFPYTPGGHVGAAASTHSCLVLTAIDNPSNDPAQHLDTGTARTGFTATRSGNACVVTYVGAGVTAVSGTLEAVSLVVGVGDGVDHEAGTIDAYTLMNPPDDATIDVTVKLRGTTTDGAALAALRTATGGASWTTSAGWRAYTTHDAIKTYTITAGADSQYKGWRGSLGSLASSTPAAFTRNGRTYTLTRLYSRVAANNNTVLMNFTSTATNAEAHADWSGVELVLGSASSVVRPGTYDAFRSPADDGTIVVGWAGFANTDFPSSGNLTATLRMPTGAGTAATFSASSVWHGVTLTSGRVTGLALPGNNLAGDAPTVLAQLAELDRLTTLDLSGNRLTGNVPGAVLASLPNLTSLNLGDNLFTGANTLTGALPAQLDALTSLTTLDLSGNAGLTADAARLGTLAGALGSLTTLDLSGTGICVPLTDTTLVGWIAAIRARTPGVARVAACGSPADPAFTAGEAVTYELVSGADGSTTAIAIGTPVFTQGTHVGGPTATCAIASARGNGSNDPDDFITTGGTNQASNFAIDPATCAITYTGTGLTSRDRTLEAVSIAVTLADGVDPDTGRLSTAADATLNVTVKLTEGQATDRDALDDFYAATGGASWTSKDYWDGYDVWRTWTITAGTSGNLRGYRDAGHGAAFGSGPRTEPVTLSGVAHNLRALFVDTSAMNRLYLYHHQSNLDESRWVNNGVWLRLSTGYIFEFAARSSFCNSGGGCGQGEFRWDNQPSAVIPASGTTFTAQAVKPDSSNIGWLSGGSWNTSWPGLTLGTTPGRVTGLALPENNLAGTIAAALEPLRELAALTALDLSGNSLTGDIPGAALDDFTGLTSLNLGGNSLTGTIPTQLGSLTSLTSLDLGGNSLTGALPTELDSLTSLTTLDLSGNAGLTADVTRLGTLAAALGSLTTLDLSGTGICVNPADTSATNTAVVTWVNAIRGTSGNVAKVDTCGTPAAAAFTEAPATVTRGLESGADGSTTAIEVGRVGFTQSNYLGATAATHTCAIASANDNASNDPADWAATGSARAGFTVALSGNACVISYGGTAATGITAADGTLEAVSILLSVSDGVDHEEGTVLGPASATIHDSQIKVNVKLRGTITDGEALNALNSASGGTGWTTWTGWRAYDFIKNLGITVGKNNTYRGWRPNNNLGTFRTSDFSTGLMRNSRSYTITRFFNEVDVANRRVTMWMDSTATLQQQRTDWNNMRLVIGTNSDTLRPNTPDVHKVGNILILTWEGFPGNAFPDSGNLDATLRTDSTSAGTLTSSSTWHGVTLTSGRVTALALPNNGLTGAAATALAALPELDQLTSLDLSGNTGLTGDIPGAQLQPLTNLTSLDLSGVGWTGTIPDELDDLTALTSLDLSDNPALTASTATLDLLAAALTSLTMLDLSGTGVCLTRGDADEAAIRTWIEGIRGQTGGVARVATCGTPAGPSFTETAVTYELTSEADGSSTAIALGTPALAVATGTHWDSGTTECSITSARQQGFGEPQFFSTWTGYTDVSSDFAIDPSTCALTYTGSGITAVDASVEAVSVRVAVNDGPDQEAGTASGAADDTIDVTVKLVGGQPDDRNALDALYAATGGDTFSWTAQTGWEGAQIHAYGATAGTAADGTKGYRNVSAGTAIGSGRTGGDWSPPGTSAGFRLRTLTLSPTNRLLFQTQQGTQGINAWAGFTLAVTAGGVSHHVKVADRSGFCNRFETNCPEWQVYWDNQPADSVPGSGAFSLRVLNPAVAIGTLSSSMWSTSWTGVTMDATSGRVTGLSLPDNNLVGGPLPAIMGDLAHLTALDLSGNAGITGAFPAFVTELTSLETLNLNGIGFTGSIPTGLGTLTSLTALDLGSNALTDAIPTQLGSLTALTDLDLSGNSLSGGVPRELETLTALTSLDLSDNAGLTITPVALAALAEDLTALTMLDLSGTGICADSGVAAVNEWIQDIREMNTNTGVAKVTTCGTPAAAAFTAPRITLGLEDGADGSTTAIAVGAPTFTQGTHAGATDTAACSITAARTNASNAPGDYSVTGGTDVSGDFAIDADTCAITYTGTGITSVDGTLEAVSIAVSISDRLDPATGMIDAAVDDTIEVTVKLRGIATDRDAIDNFHTAMAGAGWTSDLGWTERIHHTFELTGGSTVGPPARSGYFFINAQSNFGTARNSSNTFTIAGTTYTLQRLDTQANNGRVIFYVSPKTGLPANFAGFSLRNGSTTLALTDSNALTSDPNWYGWQWTSAGFTPGSGDFDVDLFNPDPSPLDSTWHGITVSGTPSRVTGLELPDNNLRGTLPSDFTELDRLTALDLSGNPGIVGDGAAPVTAIATFQRLTTLNLSGIGYSTLGAGLGPALTALTTLDLADNRLTALPSDLGSLTTLTTLDLSGNSLSGEVPDSIGDLTALTTLDLSGNRFTDIHDDLVALTALTTLDLSDNNLAAGATVDFADIATPISFMRALTSLDLSGNANLTGSIPAGLIAGLASLESLDLSGTGVCVNPATETSVETWLAAIRARASGAGVAKVATCGTPAAPAFTAESLRGSLEAAASGSGPGNAIAVGTPTFTQGTYSGGTTATCSIVTAKQNSSYDPADFTTTGVDVTGFTIDGATCAITYTGMGLTSTTAQAAVSIVVGISDGVDPAEGTLSDDADDTVQVTVKLVGLATDRIALLDLYGSAGGAGWTNSDGGWKGERVYHTIQLTAGSGTVTSSLGSGDGYQDPGVGPTGLGGVRGGRDVTVGGIITRINRVVQLANGNVVFTDNQGLRPDSDWNGLSLRLGTTTLAFSSATTSGGQNRHWTWTGQASGLIPSSGNFDALIIQANPTLTSAWDGATVSGTPSRLTALDLNDNNLAGRLPGSFVDLSALTSLDLRNNPNLRGSIPATLGSLVALTNLDLSDTQGNGGWTGEIPVELGSLTALTTLDLSGNGLSGEIPSQLGNLTALTTLDLSGNAALGGSLAGLTGLTSLTLLDLGGTRLCVNPATDTAVETWLDTLRGSGATLVVNTCGSPNAPTLADDAATYLLDAGADGSSTAVAVGTPAFTAGTYSGGTDSCVFSAVQNPSGAPASFLSTGTGVTGFTVDSSNCAITWTGSSAPTRVAGARVAVSIGLEVTDGVNATGGVDTTVDDTMQVTVRLVDLASDKLAIEALYDDTNGATSWTANANWKTSTLTGSWTGVTLTSGRLTALALPNNGLSGRLPALMGDLSRLTTLDLSRNSGLTGGIPVEFTRLRNVTSIDLRGTRICSPNISGAVNAWLNGIRANGGTVYLGSCPSPAPPGGTAGIVVAEDGPEAPSGLRYSLQLVCGASSFAISLGVGERYVATVPPDAACSLTATDRQGATEVRGEFTGLSLAGDVVVTFVRGSREEPKTEEQIAMEAVGELERELVVGTAFARWQAPEMPVADAVEELALCVVAVFWWDAREQEWRSWFPGAEGLGVNTLRTLDDGGIYLFTTEERTADNCGLLPDDAGDGEDAAGDGGDAAG